MSIFASGHTYGKVLLAEVSHAQKSESRMEKGQPIECFYSFFCKKLVLFVLPGTPS